MAMAMRGITAFKIASQEVDERGVVEVLLRAERSAAMDEMGVVEVLLRAERAAAMDERGEGAAHLEWKGGIRQGTV